jgi:DNA segregation ATPase FtsK/SpoIIIE, S-DNA-T family
MTATARSPRRKASPKGSLAPHQRKKEILGLIVMVLAVLTSLALVTFSPSDQTVLQDRSLGSIFQPGEQRARNALGLIGAYIARALVPSFLGYPVLLLAGLALAWGYVIFRSRKAKYLPLFSVVVIISALITSTLFGWFSLSLERDLLVWSGIWGASIADWMQRVFGSTGSLILLFLFLAVTALVAIERDIQRMVDRVESLFFRVKDGLANTFHSYREGREARRVNREEEEARLTQSWGKTEPNAPVARRTPEKAEAPVRPAATPPAKPLPQPEAEENEDHLTLHGLFRGEAPPPAAIETFRPRPVQRPKPAPAAEDNLTLNVQQQIQEEKADFIKRVSDVDEEEPYTFPPIDLLEKPRANEVEIDYEELEENKQVLLDKLETYNIEITGINAIVGPTVTLYELTPAPGVKISRITALEDDLAMAMAARGIRMIAPIPGKSAIGVEIPNRHRELVRIRDLIATARFRDNKMELPVAIGKTVEGEVFIEDLTKMPHLLIAGATGSGKSVGVNTLVASLLYSCHPANLKFVMIDPKKIELQQYARMVHQYGAMPPDVDQPIITDFMQALGVLKACEKEMERRYDILSKATVRGIKDYNKKVQSGQLPADEGHEHLPYIVVIVDELADLMMTAGKEIEGPIARLAQMARAVGIHLVLATQRPSVDVITGLIKANFPSRIAYQVASKVDSRTILDQNGAEGLVGNGDLLYMNGSRVIRLQGPFISVDEVDEITSYIEHQPGPGPFTLPSVEQSTMPEERELESVEDMDDLFEEAARIIVRSQQGSVSLLQRKLSVGYTRAARIVDQLEEAGIVGPFEGSKARAVLVESEIQLDDLLNAQKQQ